MLGHADNLLREPLYKIKKNFSGVKISQWFLDPLIKTGPDFIKNKTRIFSKISKNVKKIPFYISIDRKKLHSLNDSPFNQKDKFIFFFNFDFTSHIERKNPIGLINAFLLAYKDDDTTHLYLKSINGDKKLSK